MERITVKAKIDGGIHLKYGEIRKGQSYIIDPADFGAELFERPAGFESPHEKADRERLSTPLKDLAPEKPQNDTEEKAAKKNKGGE